MHATVIPRAPGMAIASLLFVAAACSGAPEKVWTPAASDLAFMGNRDGNAEIYVMRAGSKDWLNFTNSDAAENWPQWSPDGNYIAYQSNQGGNLNIWVMRADGTRKKQLTDHVAHDYSPTWSPDGSRILFASERNEPSDALSKLGQQPGTVHTYIMNADGSQQQRLLAGAAAAAGSIAWAPDGQTMALVQKTDEGTDIFLCDASGQVQKRLTEDPHANGSPAFSPDGKHIAFSCDNGTQSDLVIMHPNGTGRRAVLTGGKYYDPRWSPDGRWLVFTKASEENRDVCAVEIDGDRTLVQLASGADRETEGHWRPRW